MANGQDQNDPDILTGDDQVLAEAKKRFNRCQDWESNARNGYLNDLKFANGDSINGYQWPNEIRRNRDVDERPCLTINRTRQFNLQIINDAKQNKPTVKIRPMGEGASGQSAKIYDGVIKRIEYNSNASVAYDTATSFQVMAGIGYWRIVTDYAGKDSFDQEIFIRRVKNPLSIFMDPDINEVDGSDARFAFIFDNLPKDKFDREFPEFKGRAPQIALGGADTWVGKDYVRIAEYYRKTPKKDMLVAYQAEDGEIKTAFKSVVGDDIYKQLLENPAAEEREVLEDRIEWFKIVGDQIVDRAPWIGKYIPIVRVIGEETIIDGQLDRKGHTRALIDPQRIYNYWSSAAVEQVALQGKSPYVAPSRAIEGLETYWESANRVNHAVLPYNDIDEQGEEIRRPERAVPPEFSAGYLQGLKISQEEMMMVSGQYQSAMGEPSNEKSGKAINERQRQGDNATYHFIDNLAIAIRFTGKILIDLIPKIYDTPRIVRIMAEDGREQEITIDPSQQAAYVQKQAQTEQLVQGIFNPNVGRYDVEADIGPAYATRRQEAWNAFVQIVTQSPELTSVCGDIMFSNADFPGADEMSQRLRRLVPAAAKGDAPPPDVQELQTQLQNLQQMLAKQTQEIAEKDLKIRSHEEQKAIDVYAAQTDRITAVSNAVPELGSPKGKENADGTTAEPKAEDSESARALKRLALQTIAEALGYSLDDVIEATKPTLDAAERVGNEQAPGQV